MASKTRTTQTVTQYSRANLIIVIIASVVVLITVIAGVVVRLLVEEDLNTIILISLIFFLIVFGICVLTILWVLRARDRRKIEQKIYIKASSTSDDSKPPSYRS